VATTNTTALSAEVKTRYDSQYYMAGQGMVYFDQFCDLREQIEGERGRSYEFPILESNQPNTGILDENADVVAQQMRANAVTVTLNEYGGAIELTKFLAATAYADVYEQAAFVNGYNLAESLDFVVRAVAGQGTRQFLQNNRATRSLIDGQGTPADRLTPTFLELLHTLGRSLKMPLYDDGSLCIPMHPFVLFDLLQNSGIRDMAIRQTPEMLFNGEVAYWGGMRIINTANAKVLYGEGAAPAVAVNTTLAALGNIGDTNLKVTATTNMAVGQWLAIRDAAEPANVWSDTNELFRITNVGTAGAGGTGVDGFCLDPGPGDGGGLRYQHASGVVVRNNSSIYLLPVLGPNSVTKVCSSFTGPYGETVVTGPFDRLGRMLTFGWYAILGYARTRGGWLLRGECGSSQS
jgi:N4-gp56 family major capsid protein